MLLQVKSHLLDTPQGGKQFLTKHFQQLANFLKETVKHPIMS